MFKGGQPIAMLKYACYKGGIDFSKIKPICPAAPPKSTKLRPRHGGYVQQQGPFQQQLRADGIGHIVAQVGKRSDRAVFQPCGDS